MSDIETRKIYESIADKLNADILEPSAIDGDEFAEMFELKELILLQKQIAKAIERKVIG
jgi:hypothetical protein